MVCALSFSFITQWGETALIMAVLLDRNAAVSILIKSGTALEIIDKVSYVKYTFKAGLYYHSVYKWKKSFL